MSVFEGKADIVGSLLDARHSYENILVHRLDWAHHIVSNKIRVEHHYASLAEGGH